MLKLLIVSFTAREKRIIKFSTYNKYNGMITYKSLN